MDPLSAQLTVLFFAFVVILVAVAAGAALLFMNSQRQATFITAVIGGLDLLLAAVFWLVIWFDSTPPGVLPEVILGYAIWATVEGVVYVGLAVGIARRDKLCALLSAVLSSLSTVVYLVAVDEPSKGGLAIRFVLLAMLWRAFMQLRNDLAHEEHLAQRRRDLDQLQRASRRGFEPAALESPPPRSRRYEPRPFETTLPSEPPTGGGPSPTAPLPTQSTGRPSGQLIVKRGAPPPPVETSPAEQTEPPGDGG